jgi:arylsulfatase A-like enzyme
MKYNIIVLILTAGMMSITSSCNQLVREDVSRKPNVILILADDLGYGDLGCYGQHTLKTPHIDQMAAEGIMLSNHYAGSTVCAPSRASLLTGKHPGHVSVRGNYEGMLLGDEETILAEILKESGLFLRVY